MATRVRNAAGTSSPTAPGPGTTARRPRAQLGDEVYLWVLVALELALTAHLRARFRGAHGG